LGKEQLYHVHLTLLPYLAGSKELKTKPTQLSVRELRRIGIRPHMILARADHAIPPELLDKISGFCSVHRDAVLPLETLSSIYDVPAYLQKHDIAGVIGIKLGLRNKPNMKPWIDGAKRHAAAKKTVKVALVGKYTNLEDAYLSVIEAIKTAAVFEGAHAEILWIDSEKLEKEDKKEWARLREADGIVVPGGFGKRGIEGKIKAARYARTEKVPYLGLCLGAQILAIEFARAALNDPALTSEEFDEGGKLSRDKYVVHFLPGQSNEKAKGGTLRLGAYDCTLLPGSKAAKAYGSKLISERHRHRYEFNQAFREALEKKGLVFSGLWKERGLMEIVEVKDHPFMLGSQFHPEFKSRPHKPHPLFAAFMEEAVR
jgi:CTP synthase